MLKEKYQSMIGNSYGRWTVTDKWEKRPTGHIYFRCVCECTVKPIVKEHMCGECYTDHNEWLKYLISGTTTVKDGIRIDADGYYTIYESEQPSLRKKLHKTVLDGLDKRLEQSINESGARE